jgi:hypothetical protein
MLEDAMNKITVAMLNTLEHGEELELNSEYTLYHYTEDDIFVLNETDEWEEIYQVMYEGDEIIFEAL